MRVVYSFSVPDNSVAHWELKKWKSSGQNVSRMIQKLIEGEGSQILHLEKEMENQRRIILRQQAVLGVLGTNAADWRLMERRDGEFMVHGGAISEEHAQHIVKQAINIAEHHTTFDYSKEGEEE